MIDMNSCMGLRWFSSKALFLVLVTKACFYGQAQVQSGSVDETFKPPQFISDFSYLAGWGTVIGLAVTRQDEIYIGGHFTHFESMGAWEVWNGLTRLKSNGEIDEGFSIPRYNSTAGSHID